MPAPTWRDRLRWRLFPARHCDVPPAPAAFKDCLNCVTEVQLSWRDRLRVFLTGRLVVQARIVTEEKIGRTATNSSAHVLPWKWMERRPPQLYGDQQTKVGAPCD